LNWFKNNIEKSIILCSFLIFLPFLGSVHLFDWDEVNFAECAREMLESKNYLNLQMNYLPFWEKPPLFIWLSALCMKIFGVNEFAARLPNAICGMVTLLLLFKIGKKLFDEKLGLIWIMCYAGSTLPQFYFKSGIIDPWFNLFIFSSIYYFILFTFNSIEFENKKWNFLFYSSLLLGLAILTKGPAAAVIAGLCLGLYILLKKFKSNIKLNHLLVFFIVTLITGGFWFLLLVLNGKYYLIEHFVNYQMHLIHSEDAGHGGPFYYHFLVLLIGCFPASIFAMTSININFQNPIQKQFNQWMLILFCVVLILFSSIETKILHYSSLCYFPLTFFAALNIYKLLEGQLSWKKWMSVLLLLIGGIFSLAILVISIIPYFINQIVSSKIIQDEFVIENLKAQVNWSGWEILISLLSLFFIVYSVILLQSKKMQSAIILLFIGNLFTVQLTTIIIIPKIEQYTQGAAIEFFESSKKEDVYFLALNYRSYAQYFYTKKLPPQNSKSLNMDWLLRGPIDKDLKVITKFNSNDDILERYPDFKLVGHKNGYSFYLRKASKITE
jgi:4-amino-4-deoxy-L-arabinose transferase-like glycosyltransferase